MKIRLTMIDTNEEECVLGDVILDPKTPKHSTFNINTYLAEDKQWGHPIMGLLNILYQVLQKVVQILHDGSGGNLEEPMSYDEMVRNSTGEEPVDLDEIY